MTLLDAAHLSNVEQPLRVQRRADRVLDAAVAELKRRRLRERLRPRLRAPRPAASRRSSAESTTSSTRPPSSISVSVACRRSRQPRRPARPPPCSPTLMMPPTSHVPAPAPRRRRHASGLLRATARSAPQTEQEEAGHHEASASTSSQASARSRASRAGRCSLTNSTGPTCEPLVACRVVGNATIRNAADDPRRHEIDRQQETVDCGDAPALRHSLGHVRHPVVRVAR